MKILKGSGLGAFARQGALVFGAQMAVNLSNFLFHAFISRRIGVAQYGALNALISAFNVFGVVAIVITTVVAKTVAELRSVDANGRIRDFLARISIIFGLAAAMVMLAGWLLSPAIASYLRISSTQAVVLTVAILAVNFALPLRGALQGAEMFGSYSASLIIEAVLKVAIGIGFVLLGFGLNGALGGWVAGVTISLAYTLLVVALRFGGARESVYNIDYARVGMATVGTICAGVVLALMQFSDVVIVKHFVDPTQAGLYAAAALAGRMLFLVVNFVPIILLPHAVRAARENDSPEHVLVRALVTVLALSAVGVAVYAIVPSVIVGTLAGAQFRPAAPLLLPYAIAAMSFALLNTVVIYRIGVHRLQFLAPLALVAAAEIAAMWEFHASGFQVIEILIAGNACGLLACCYRLRASKKSSGVLAVH